MNINSDYFTKFQSNINDNIAHIPILVDKVSDSSTRIDYQNQFQINLKNYLKHDLKIQEPKISMNAFLTDLRHSNFKAIIRNIRYISSNPGILIFSERHEWKLSLSSALKETGFENILDLSHFDKNKFKSKYESNENIKDINEPTITNNIIYHYINDIEYTVSLILEDLKKRDNSLSETERHFKSQLKKFDNQIHQLKSYQLSQNDKIELKNQLIELLENIENTIKKTDDIRTIPTGCMSLVVITTTLLSFLGVAPTAAFTVSSAILGGKEIQQILSIFFKK